MDKFLIESKLKRLKLEDVHQHKLELIAEINLQKDVITYTTKRMIAPFNPNSSGFGVHPLKKVNTGIAVFDGIMMGYKFIKNIKRFFRRR